MKKQFRSFNDAREFVHSLGLNNYADWYAYCKSGKKPDDIPKYPNETYKKEWKGIGDWLGTGRISNKNRQFHSFEDARKFAQKLGLKSYTEWTEFRKSDKKPKNIPSNPVDYYEKEWTSWGDFLGTGSIAPQYREFLSYLEAKKKLHQLKIQGSKIYREYARKGKLPLGIPRDPPHAYKNKGWEDWGKFLETGRIANQNRDFLSFEDAKKFIQTLKIQTKEKWSDYCKSGKKPDDIPASPPRAYKKEWVSWADWLGSGIISTANKSKLWLHWSIAKPLYQKIAKENNIKTPTQWKIFLLTHKLPKNLPRHPELVYSKKRIEKNEKKV